MEMWGGKGGCLLVLAFFFAPAVGRWVTVVVARETGMTLSSWLAAGGKNCGGSRVQPSGALSGTVPQIVETGGGSRGTDSEYPHDPAG